MVAILWSHAVVSTHFSTKHSKPLHNKIKENAEMLTEY